MRSFYYGCSSLSISQVINPKNSNSGQGRLAATIDAFSQPPQAVFPTMTGAFSAPAKSLANLSSFLWRKRYGSENTVSEPPRLVY